MRNAATGCRLAVDLHAEECHGDDTDESLSVARRQLMIMEDRLRQLLQMGQGASGAGDREIDFAGLVSESVAMIRPAAAHAKVDFSWAEPEQPVVVSADPEMLGQAVMNLLLNALDAAVKNQASGAGAGSVSVRLRRDGGESELVVADSGAGPSEELAGDVFEPFVTGKAEGVGLGLAVAQRVVESCGGRIEWGRDTGLTKFTIRLAVGGSGGTPWLRYWSSTTNRRSAGRWPYCARAWGTRCRARPRRRRGCATRRRVPPDLLILDVRLPGMDGLTALEHFRRYIGGAPDNRDHGFWGARHRR